MINLLQGIQVGAVAPDDDDGQHAARGGQPDAPALAHDGRLASLKIVSELLTFNSRNQTKSNTPRTPTHTAWSACLFC